jgi:dihydroorotate dehydrogenase
VQLYSSLVYHGVELVTEIKEDLSRRLRKDGFANVSDAVGAAFPEISGKSIPVDEARAAREAEAAKKD